jgi:hypothetical protein
MSVLIKIINESVALVETSLGLVAPLLTNNYDKWTQDPTESWDISPSTQCNVTSGDDLVELDCFISKQFYLLNPARVATLTVRGSRTPGAGDTPGSTIAQVRIIKPDTSTVSLYYEYGACGLTYYLNAADIKTSLNQAGTYTLEFEAIVQSGVTYGIDYDTYYPSTVQFNNVVFTVDCELPGQPTGFAGHAENSTQVHVSWTGGVKTDSYAVYYRKREFTG